MALPLSSLIVPVIESEVEASRTNASEVGVLAAAPTVICFSGTGGMPGLNTPQRYTPSIVLRVNAPLVLVCPPVPKPPAVPPVVDVDTGRQNTPALETALPPESSTVPVMVLSAVESVKANPGTP